MLQDTYLSKCLHLFIKISNQNKSRIKCYTPFKRCVMQIELWILGSNRSQLFSSWTFMCHWALIRSWYITFPCTHSPWALLHWTLCYTSLISRKFTKKEKPKSPSQLSHTKIGLQGTISNIHLNISKLHKKEKSMKNSQLLHSKTS
jgi:hypothetical protein